MSRSSEPKDGEPRRAERLRHLRRAEFSTPKLHGQGHLCQVSEIGLFLRCDELPEIGESVRVTLLEPTPHFIAAGTVKSLCEDGPERGFGMAIAQAGPRWQALIASLRQARDRSE